MTLTSHTLIYHCLISLHQTIVQNRFLKVSAIAYMSKSDVKAMFPKVKTLCLGPNSFLMSFQKDHPLFSRDSTQV